MYILFRKMCAIFVIVHPEYYDQIAHCYVSIQASFEKEILLQLEYYISNHARLPSLFLELREASQLDKVQRPKRRYFMLLINGLKPYFLDFFMHVSNQYFSEIHF